MLIPATVAVAGLAGWAVLGLEATADDAELYTSCLMRNGTPVMRDMRSAQTARLTLPPVLLSSKLMSLKVSSKMAGRESSELISIISEPIHGREARRATMGES